MNLHLKRWLEDPFTLKFFELLAKDRNEQVNRMLNLGVLTSERLSEIAELKGYINALDSVLNTDSLENLFDGEISND
jgi:hypothetical protein